MSAADSNVPEGFRQIPGFPRYSIAKDGTVLSFCGRRPRRLSPVVATDGYLAFNLCVEPGRVRQVKVHTLVLITFVSARPVGMQCRHLDGNRMNNHVSNLAWGSLVENRRDRIRHGTSSEGEKNGSSKLSESDIREIRNRRSKGDPLRVLAADYGVSASAISNIALRITWKHIE